MSFELSIPVDDRGVVVDGNTVLVEIDTALDGDIVLVEIDTALDGDIVLVEIDTALDGDIVLVEIDTALDGDTVLVEIDMALDGKIDTEDTVEIDTALYGDTVEIDTALYGDTVKISTANCTKRKRNSRAEKVAIRKVMTSVAREEERIALTMTIKNTVKRYTLIPMIILIMSGEHHFSKRRLPTR